jgi:hypothetical protein
MTRSSLRRLLDRGRKAGLNADELYRALAAYKPSLGDAAGKSDNNGFVAKVKENGQRDYRAASEQ